MSLTDLLAKSRSLSFGALVAIGLGAGAMGCSAAAVDGEVEEEGVSVDDITQTTDTKVKRQSIGNCWLYAVASWVEAINKRQTGTDLNTSESYWTYWHWFEQLANGRGSTEISTGGSYGTAAGLIDRYGIMTEKDFIPEETEAEMSARQSSALDTINASLKNGALKDPAVRADRAKVRAELDKAWRLSPEVVTKLNNVFGAGVTRTLDRSFTNRQPGNSVLRARDLEVRIFNFATNRENKATLKDAIGTGSWVRSGPKAFHEENYPSSADGRRRFQIAVQQSLHAGVPVIISWKVDFNALATDAKFSIEELTRRGPGRQGGHMTVATDYQVKLVDGKLLKAGENVTDTNLLRSALEPAAQVEFFRVKNSWGAIRPDRWLEAAKPGYHDLTTGYMNGPIKECTEKNGTSDPNDCPRNVSPWWDAVLPAGIGTDLGF
jgi:hypothetical protein